MPDRQELRSRCVQLDVPKRLLQPLKQRALREGVSIRDLLSTWLVERIVDPPDTITPALPDRPTRNVGARVSLPMYRWIRYQAARRKTTMHRLCYGLVKPRLDRLGT